MVAQRGKVVPLYSDLARQAGEEKLPISTTRTETLMNECRRIIKDLDLL
jgi:hypothetical protein